MTVGAEGDDVDHAAHVFQCLLGSRQRLPFGGTFGVLPGMLGRRYDRKALPARIDFDRQCQGAADPGVIEPDRKANLQPRLAGQGATLAWAGFEVDAVAISGRRFTGVVGLIDGFGIEQAQNAERYLGRREIAPFCEFQNRVAKRPRVPPSLRQNWRTSSRYNPFHSAQRRLPKLPT